MLNENRILKIVGTPIEENRKMWRYIRLSTLLMLLAKRVYIPTIEQLRLTDPTESTFTSKQTEFYLNNLPDEQCRLLEQRCDYREGELLKQFRTPEMLKVTLQNVWERELRRLRCAWCWYAADIESMAMWNLYAHDGAAIATTVANIERSFRGSNSVNMGIVAQVAYVGDAEPDLSDAFLRRPYLVKQECYRHEHEVRVILPKSPDDDAPGLLLENIDPYSLITEIQLSPHIEQSEAQALMSIIEKLTENRIIVYQSKAKKVIRSLHDIWDKMGPVKGQISCFGKESPVSDFADPVLRDM